jgi:hypothetical protein
MQEKSTCVIYKCLSDGIYKTRFYQWLGYQKNTYHIIYQYDSYRFMIGYSSILHLLDNILDKNTLNYHNVYMICNNKNLYLEMFLKNTMDITSPSEICLYDY